MEFNRNLIDTEIQIDTTQDQLRVDEPVVGSQRHLPISFACHNLWFRIDIPKFGGAAKKEVKKPVVNGRNKPPISPVVALDTVRFYNVEIVALYFGEAGKYRLDRKLAVTVNNPDIFAAASLKAAPHVPSHSSLFWLG